MTSLGSYRAWLADPSASHACLGFAIAAELRAGRAAVATAGQASLSDLAAELAPAADAAALDQLAAVAQTLAARFRLAEGPARRETLLLDEVLATGLGHPLVVAIAAVEAGRRAAIPIGVLQGDHRVLLAHPLVAEPWALDLAAGRLVRLEPPAQLRWASPHACAAALLDLLATSARDAGELAALARVQALQALHGAGS